MNRYPGAKPLYAQAMDDMKSRITREEWVSGHRIPGEKELCELYKVSRTCIRQAISALRTEGYLYSIQGKGTYVSNVTPNAGWARLTTFESHYREKWPAIGAHTLKMETAAVPDKAAGFLGVSRGSTVLSLTRVRLVDASPVLIQRHYLSPRVPVEVFEKHPEFISFSRLLEEHAGLVAASARDLVRAVPCPKADAEILRVKPRSPVLYIERYSRDREGRPLEYAEITVCTEAWPYEATIHASREGDSGAQI